MAIAKALTAAAEGPGRRGRAPDRQGGAEADPAEPEPGLEPVRDREPLTAGRCFNAVSWNSAAKANVSWNSVSWNDVSWADGSGADVSWLDVSWSTTSPGPTSPGPTSPGRRLLGRRVLRGRGRGRHDSADPNGYVLTPEQAAEIMADPDTRSRPERSAGRRRRGTARATTPAPPARPERPARPAQAGRSDRLAATDGAFLSARAGSNPGPHSFGGYSGRTQKGGCCPSPGGLACSSGERDRRATPRSTASCSCGSARRAEMGDRRQAMTTEATARRRPPRWLRERRSELDRARRRGVPSGSPKLAPRAAAYFVLIAVVTAAAVPPLFSRLGTHSPGWTTFVVLALIAAVAQLFVVRTPRNQSYHTTIVFLIPAAMLLPPELVALVGVDAAHPGVAEAAATPGTSRPSTSATGRSRCWPPTPPSTASSS